MGLKDFLPHRSSSTRGETSAADAEARVPHGDEPGADSMPGDDGKGTIGLEDRQGPGAPDTNQAQTEPMPATPGQADPNANPTVGSPEPPELAEMNVGAADPQTPSHGAARPRDAASASAGADVAGGPVNAGTTPAEDRPSAGGGAPGLDGGPAQPHQDTVGRAQRATGSMGTTGPDEQMETDVAVGADRTRTGSPSASVPASGSELPGDGYGSPVTSDRPAAGTSEEQPVVMGVRAAVDEPDAPE